MTELAHHWLEAQRARRALDQTRGPVIGDSVATLRPSASRAVVIRRHRRLSASVLLEELEQPTRV